MNVIFVEPAFPDNQRSSSARCTASARGSQGSASVRTTGLTTRSDAGSPATSRSRSVTDEGALHDAVRRVQAREWVDRLEATVEAHILPTARVREACTIPGHLNAHRLSLPRQGGDEGGAARGGRALRRIGRRLERFRGPRVRGAVGFPLIIKPRAAAGAAGTHRANNERELDHVPARDRGRARRVRGDRGVRRRPRGLLRHAVGQRARRARFHQPLLPERPRSDAHALDLAADRRHQSHGRAGVRARSKQWAAA